LGTQRNMTTTTKIAIRMMTIMIMIQRIPSLLLISCKTSGRRVTMPDPRGKKSLSEINTDHDIIDTEISKFYMFSVPIHLITCTAMLNNKHSTK